MLATWPNYHDPANFDAFTAETGAAVDLNVFGSNEEMLAKLQAGGSGWDVFVPTNYTITTYVGEGTDWLDDADAARVAAGGTPQRVGRLAPFDVGIFKGKLATDRPAIHRSPPIAGTAGGARLLLVLNPASRSIVESAHSPLPPLPHLP